VVKQHDGELVEQCTSVQYVPGLLPLVGKTMQAWQQLISDNQVRTLARMPAEFQTPCMLNDQVYNRGDYYAKGLVIQEWHSNGKQRQLSDYSKKTFGDDLFVLPDGYRQFSPE
jgi:hypothetical protein